MIGIEEPTLVRATEHIPEMAAFVAEARGKRISLTAPTTAPSTSASPKFPSTASSRNAISAACWMAPASMSMNMIKTAPAISPSGKLPSPEKPRGIRQSARAVPAGTSSAPSCRCRSWEKLSTCTPAAKTSYFRIMKMKSRNRNLLPEKPFAHFWFHARFLLVEGEKMSKSLGNFFTLRDLFSKVTNPRRIRYFLPRFPTVNQLNFTFDGLKQAAVSVERLRNFRLRLNAGIFLRRQQR